MVTITSYIKKTYNHFIHKKKHTIISTTGHNKSYFNF